MTNLASEENSRDTLGLSLPGAPDLQVLWAAAWRGRTVRCLFHREPKPTCTACCGTHDWSLLHQAVASLAELLNAHETSGATQMIVLIRDREMQITAVGDDGPLITLAVPPGPEVGAAQSWMQRWAALTPPWPKLGEGAEA